MERFEPIWHWSAKVKPNACRLLGHSDVAVSAKSGSEVLGWTQSQGQGTQGEWISFPNTSWWGVDSHECLPYFFPDFCLNVIGARDF